MYEVMMYAGIIGCIVFFVLSVVLFIKNKIPSSIMYFVNLRRKGVDIGSAGKKRAVQKPVKEKKTVLLEDSAEGGEYEPTEYLDEAGESSGGQSGSAGGGGDVYEPTEFLDEANDSPTELLP